VERLANHFRRVEDVHQALLRIQVIKTSYMGATDFKGVQEQSKLSLDSNFLWFAADKTYAKAYLLKRHTGFSTS
jgi:hypothetical protein